MVTYVERFIDQRVDLVGARADETKRGRVIAYCNGSKCLQARPSYPGGRSAGGVRWIGRGERFGLASVFMTRSSPGGPRVGLVQS